MSAGRVLPNGFPGGAGTAGALGTGLEKAAGVPVVLAAARFAATAEERFGSEAEGTVAGPATVDESARAAAAAHAAFANDTNGVPR
ncbi:hypothetical protein [Arthrobacter sp. 92]|uniref:hypothetical protein n=1 Tax=Arthrobacter sp. 92 TaxID=3418175 RepID=UPI003D04E739